MRGECMILCAVAVVAVDDVVADVADGVAVETGSVGGKDFGT